MRDLNKEAAVEEQINDAPLDLKADNVFDDAAADTIPLKYRGTLADQKDMSILGKKQVLRRNFKFVTMVGFASTVIVSWEILLPWVFCCSFTTLCDRSLT